MLAEYLTRHVPTYYRLPDGRPSREQEDIRYILDQLIKHCGDVPVNQLTRHHVKETQTRMVAAGLSRKVVNQRIGRVKRAFRWLAEEQLVPEALEATVARIAPLPAHRSAAPERAPVTPVAGELVARTAAVVGEPWASLIRLQWHTGMRPGEVTGLRVEYLAPAGPRTLAADFRAAHKMGYKGKRRVVLVGRRGVTCWPRGCSGPSYAARTTCSCRCEPSGPCWSAATRPPWLSAARNMACRTGTRTRFRHTYATRVRKRFGLDGAQVALGHSRADVTQVYAEVDAGRAADIARDMG